MTLSFQYSFQCYTARVCLSQLWGHYWHLEVRGQGHSWMPHCAQDSPSQQRIIWCHISVVPRLRNPPLSLAVMSSFHHSSLSSKVTSLVAALPTPWVRKILSLLCHSLLRNPILYFLCTFWYYLLLYYIFIFTTHFSLLKYKHHEFFDSFAATSVKPRLLWGPWANAWKSLRPGHLGRGTQQAGCRIWNHNSG